MALIKKVIAENEGPEPRNEQKSISRPYFEIFQHGGHDITSGGPASRKAGRRRALIGANWIWNQGAGSGIVVSAIAGWLPRLRRVEDTVDALLTLKASKIYAAREKCVETKRNYPYRSFLNRIHRWLLLFLLIFFFLAAQSPYSQPACVFVFRSNQ